MSTLVPVSLGLVFGASVVTALAAWRGFEVRDDARPALRRDVIGMRTAAPLVAGLIVLALTRWPVGALLAAGGVAL
ncbi:MAG: hypothetical protein ACRDWD_09090, partial [Acidimicrobiia bacterium]